MDINTSTTPLFSIVTICYNAAKELPLTMESVLAQDYTDYEYIIEDGDSTDDTPSIVESYRKSFEEKGIRFIYNRKKDKGIYDAMNLGVLSASGSYVNFMNAGDCFYSADVLSKIAADSSLLDATVIYGDCAEYEFKRFNLFIKNMDKICEVMPFSHQSVFAKRDFLIEHPFKLNLKYSADYDFLLTAFDLNEKFADSQIIVCITTKDGVSSVNYHDMLLESADILKSHGKYAHTDEELLKIEKTLRIKQFVLDHFPTFIKKAIRTIQIKQRGQEFECQIPPWYLNRL